MISGRRPFLFVGVGAAALVILGAALFAVRASPASSFPHHRHAKAGVRCETCHAYVREEAFAGRPDGTTCRMCHADGRSWSPMTEPVIRVPDHVFFPHRRHVGVAGIDCAVCHGDVGVSRRVASRPPVEPSMNFCVNCHETAGATTDCIACHR